MSPASLVTTHVLDTGTGRPAAGVAVRLSAVAGDIEETVAESVTDIDGRVRDLGPGSLPPGTYRLTFATGAYFAAEGREAFFPEVVLTVELRELVEGAHYHVPLLVSPFSYTTYRGS